MSNMRNLIFFLALFSSLSSIGQTQNYWVKKADFGGLKRERAVAFSIDQFGYVGTGIDTNEVVHNDFWKYDPSIDAWTQVASLPSSVRRNAIAFSIHDKGYVGTGMNTASSGDFGATKLSDFWEYAPTTNTWTQKANFPGNNGNGIYFATGFSIDSKGYVCGGKMGPNWYSSQLWEYKPSTNQWIQLANFPGGVRYQLSSLSIGYKGYVGLGTDNDLYRNDWWEFNAATNQWTERSPLPASERASAVTFTLGERGYVCMGTNGGMLDDLWEYNPYTDDWSVRASYGGSRRKGAVAFSINDKGYVGTGKGNSGKKKSFHEYNPPSTIGLNEQELFTQIYPNPTRGKLQIKSSTEIDRCEIYSVVGKLHGSFNQISSIDISSYPSGNYIVFAYNGNGDLVSQSQLIKL